MNELTPRQKDLLIRVIESHIATSLPVGSRTLTERYDLHLSPASVRHEMGILEEQGYLTHPHTSAGRLPTDQGYQFYVQEAVREEPVSNELSNYMAQEMEKRMDNLDDLMIRASSVLSAIVKEAVLVTSPIPRSEPTVFVEGSRYILNQPEFQDLKKFQLLMETLEERPRLADLLKSRSLEQGVTVAIGERELSKNIWDCALVTAPYGQRIECVGLLAVLGPRRMPYGKIMGWVRQTADKLTQILARVDS